MNCIPPLPSTLPPPSSGTIEVPRSRGKWVDTCPACDGHGRHQVVDTDDDDRRLIEVECEYCEASGSLANCVACDEIMSAPEADANGFLCAGCREQLGGVDADEERAELRRVG